MAAMVKIIEVLAPSETSWDDAAKVAVEEASKTLRGIQSLRGGEPDSPAWAP